MRSDPLRTVAECGDQNAPAACREIGRERFSAPKNCFLRFRSYLCPQIWFPEPRCGEGIKRESGVNPEQSRCCETPFTVRISRPLILCDREGFGSGVSQKTCQIDSIPLCPEGWDDGSEPKCKKTEQTEESGVHAALSVTWCVWGRKCMKPEKARRKNRDWDSQNRI